MAKEINLNGWTADQLSEMIRESLRDELRQLRPVQPKTDTKYLTRHGNSPSSAHLARDAHRLGESRIKSAPTKSAGVFCSATSDVDAALNRIVPIK